MQKNCIFFFGGGGVDLYVSHTLFILKFISMEFILYLEKNYTLFGNLAVATLTSSMYFLKYAGARVFTAETCCTHAVSFSRTMIPYINGMI